MSFLFSFRLFLFFFFFFRLGCPGWPGLRLLAASLLVSACKPIFISVSLSLFLSHSRFILSSLAVSLLSISYRRPISSLVSQIKRATLWLVPPLPIRRRAPWPHQLLPLFLSLLSPPLQLANLLLSLLLLLLPTMTILLSQLLVLLPLSQLSMLLHGIAADAADPASYAVAASSSAAVVGAVYAEYLMQRWSPAGGGWVLRCCRCLSEDKRRANAIILGRLTYAIQAWAGYLSQYEIDRVDKLLCKAHRWGLTTIKYNYGDLLYEQDVTLFRACQQRGRCRSHQLTLKPKSNMSLRPRGHPFVIPRLTYQITRNSFINRSFVHF